MPAVRLDDDDDDDDDAVLSNYSGLILIICIHFYGFKYFHFNANYLQGIILHT